MRKNLLALAVVAVCAVSANAAMVGTFTGGDAGEGLDMQGNFVYAINIASYGGAVIGDAHFTAGYDASGQRPLTETPGFTISANLNGLTTTPAYDFGSSANDTALRSVLGTGYWAGPDAGTLSFDLQPGTYKIQLFAAEAYATVSRPVNIDFGNNGSIDASMDSAANGNIGVVATETFTMATAGTYTVAYSNDIYPNVPWLSGATVEVVPEPATMALLAIGGLGALIRRRK